MAGKIRLSREQIVQRGHDIWQRRLRNVPVKVIARDLGLAEAYVKRIIYQASHILLNEMREQVEHEKIIQTEQLRGLYAEAYEEWQKSKLPHVKQTESQESQSHAIEQTSAPGKSMARTKKGTDTVKQTTHGDAALLECLRGILSDIRKIWGLDAPAKVAATNAEGRDLPAMSPLERARRMEAIGMLANLDGKFVPLPPPELGPGGLIEQLVGTPWIEATAQREEASRPKIIDDVDGEPSQAE